MFLFDTFYSVCYPDHFSDQSKLRGGVYFIGDEELPLTASGKIIRRKVKELAIRLLKEKTAI